MDKYRRANQILWDELVDIHARSDMYALEEFRRGKKKLNKLERSEVGNVKGKSLLHLQCHFGMDTLSWAMLGAQVTGVDFSSKAIDLAKSLTKDLNIPGEFVCCELYDLPNHLDKQFDIVFTSYGVLCWLPDLTRWAQLISHFLKPGGFFYIAESHPVSMVFDDDVNLKELQVHYPYFNKKATRFDVDGDYADPDARVKNKTDYEWTHPMGEIVTSLVDAGLQIEFLHEFPELCWRQFPFQEKGRDGWYRLPKGMPSIPLAFSLKARKPA